MATLKNFLASPSQEVQYTYVRNQIRELKSVTSSNNLYQWTGATVGTQSYAANGLNQYTTATGITPSYDASGNLKGDGIWSYSYDTDNRLRTANKTGLASTLTYDPEGRLRQTVIGAATTTLLYDADKLVAEYDAAGTTVLRKYVHGPGTDEPIVWYEGASTTAKNWLYADHLGSIVATANATGASTARCTYGPFGEPSLTTGIRFRYTGQQLIGELGLYYYKARFYSPSLGRFDPIGYKDDQNLYAYAGNNPANKADPHGTDAIVVTSGSSVHIFLPMTFGGPGATPANIENAMNGIREIWSGLLGGKDVQTTVFEGTMNGITNSIELLEGARGFQPYVLMPGPSQPGNSGVWQTDNASLNAWEAAHETGHLLGLGDQYNANGALAGYDGNLLAEVNGTTLTSQQMNQVINTNNGISGTMSGVNSRSPVNSGSFK